MKQMLEIEEKWTLGELLGLPDSSPSEGFSSACRVIQDNLTLSNRVTPELVQVFIFRPCSGSKVEPVQGKGNSSGGSWVYQTCKTLTECLSEISRITQSWLYPQVCLRLIDNAIKCYLFAGDITWQSSGIKGEIFQTVQLEERWWQTYRYVILMAWGFRKAFLWRTDKISVVQIQLMMRYGVQLLSISKFLTWWLT